MWCQQRRLEPVAPPPPVAPRPAVRASDEPAGISGPSFLGLNEPRPSAQPRRHGSLSIDPNSAPSSRSLDYLLEDDHEHKSGGALKFVLILFALALAVGFGYLRFKNQGLAWLKGNAGKPPAAQSSETSDSGSTAPAANTDNSAPANSAPNSAPAPAAAQPPAGAAPASGADSSGGTLDDSGGNKSSVDCIFVILDSICDDSGGNCAGKSRA